MLRPSFSESGESDGYSSCSESDISSVGLIKRDDSEVFSLDSSNRPSLNESLSTTDSFAPLSKSRRLLIAASTSNSDNDDEIIMDDSSVSTVASLKLRLRRREDSDVSDFSFT